MVGAKVSQREIVVAGACWRSYHARAAPRRVRTYCTLFVGLFIMATVIIAATSDDGLMTATQG